MAPNLLQPALLVVIFSLFSISFCSDARSLKELTKVNNQLAADLHKAIGAEEKGNIFISPLSISIALGMLLYGARGETEEEMYRVLGYDETDLTKNQVHTAFQSLLETLNSPDQDYLLYIANAILAQKEFPIESKYKTDIQRFYLATARDVDFVKDSEKVIEDINEWVNQATKGNIKNMLDDLEPETVLVLLNAIYFKGAWKTQFNAKYSQIGTFYNSGNNNSEVDVEMMRLDHRFLYLRSSGFRVLELPYKGNHVSMMIFLPDARNGVFELEKSLTSNTIAQIRGLMKIAKLELSLPKFKLEYGKELNDVLMKLGLKKIFQDNADLRGISRGGNIAVSKVTHKAAIEVNEEGSEAGGRTQFIQVTRTSYDPLLFTVDHPFLFAIVDKRTDVIYFQGRVAEL